MIEALDSLLEQALARAAAEPDAQARARRDAVARLRTTGLPDTRVEAWKYTSLAPIAKTPYRLATVDDAGRLDQAEFAALERASAGLPTLVIANGTLRTDLGDLDRLPDGVSVRAASSGDAIERDAGEATGAEAAFSALNEAALSDFIVVEVAANADIGDALALVFIGAGEPPLLRSPRVLVRCGRHSRLRLIEEYLSAGADQGLTNVVTTVALADGAELFHHRLQSEALTSAHVGRIEATVGRDARFHSDSVAFGSRLCRVDIDVALAERGAACRLNGLFAGDGDQHIDHHTTVDHRVGDTHSEELYRGILDGSSRGVFNGKVIVHRDAQRISARQASNNLLLSRKAEIDTKPELEIYADDVTCAHGATVGELDQAALFYLRSRGVPECEARALLIYAFAEQVVSAVPLESLKRAIEKRFIGHNEPSTLARDVVDA